jgi:hypothetical protein
MRDEEPIMRLFLNGIYVSQSIWMSVSNFLHLELNSVVSCDHHSGIEGDGPFKNSDLWYHKRTKP